MTGWTDERAALAAQLWKDGKSAGEITKTIPGVSRSAVLGKMQRMGMLRGRPTNAGGAPKTVWTTERDDRLRALYADGKPYHDIGYTLGCGAEAARMRANRLGLKRDNGPKRGYPRKAAPSAYGHQTDPKEAEKVRAKLREVGRSALSRIEAPVDVTGAKLLMERRFGECAWPVGVPERPAGQLCCAAPAAEGSAYCTKHRRMGTTGQTMSVKELTHSVRRAA